MSADIKYLLKMIHEKFIKKYRKGIKCDSLQTAFKGVRNLRKTGKRFKNSPYMLTIVTIYETGGNYFKLETVAAESGRQQLCTKKNKNQLHPSKRPRFDFFLIPKELFQLNNFKILKY